MKLDETTIDEKENTCNGNGLPNKLIIKDISSSASSNGDLLDDSGSNETAAGVGDLLVEDTSVMRNDCEENGFQNGSKADDSTSVSSSSSNFPITDFQQDDISDDDEMTLRLSEEEDLSEPGNNVPETDTYFTSSPFPKAVEDKNEGASTSAVEDSNSDKSKDTNKLVVEEKINNKNSESENSETCDEQNSSIDKSDNDNLENLVSDLNEDSKSALQSENKKVTISELRQEIEDFIKNHDTDNELKTNPEKTKLNIKITETKSVKSDEIHETQSTETEIKQIKLEINDITSVELNTISEESETIDTKIEENDSIDIKMEEIAVVDNQQINSLYSLKNEPQTTDSVSPEMETKPSTSKLQIKTEKLEKSDDIFSAKTNVDDIETKSSVVENKQLNTMDTDETIAPDNTEMNKTNEPDMRCQINIGDSEKNETANTNKTETSETKNKELEITSIENNINIEAKQNIVDNTEEEEKKEYTELKNVSLESMDVDSNETESKIKENKTDTIEKATIIRDDDDDVVMQEDFEKTNKKTPIEETDNKINQEDKLNKVKLVENDSKDKDIKVGEKKENKIEVKDQDGAKEECTKGSEDTESSKAEDERPSLKRTLENEEEVQDAKKPKMNGVKKLEEPKEYVRSDIFREFMSKKEVATLTRAEIEQFCLHKMCEAITQNSKIGELNRKIIQQESMIEALRTKYSSLTKQVRDLEVVHSRVLQEVRAKTKDGNIEVTPVKITRSVGLQVSLQPIAGRVRQVIPTPEIVKRKIPQRTSLPTKLTAIAPSTSMPPPPAPPIHKSPNQGKGIKTILPKVYPPAEPKDLNSSLLGSYLQNPSTSKSPTGPPGRKPSPAPTPSTSAAATDATPKVIDLTDEDDIQKASGSNATASTSGNIRVVSPQQLQNTTTTPVTTASLPRLTYLVQGNQQGQQVLLATSTAPTRPGQVRSTLMFKPVAPGQVPPGQRVNIVRPNNVPGITVLPSTSSPAIRPSQQIRFAAPSGSRPQIRAAAPVRHPAPLPGPPNVQPSQPNWKAMPPKPTLKISRVGDGIVLSWRMQNNKDMSLYEDIGSYQLYAYQETSGPPSTDMWRKVGDVKALALPMACTLTQFTDGNKYHFAVRAVDVKSRVGPFSQPEQIALP